jgi:hypothetical protein
MCYKFILIKRLAIGSRHIVQWEYLPKILTLGTHTNTQIISTNCYKWMPQIKDSQLYARKSKATKFLIPS